MMRTCKELVIEKAPACFEFVNVWNTKCSAAPMNGIMIGVLFPGVLFI